MCMYLCICGEGVLDLDIVEIIHFLAEERIGSYQKL